LPSEPFDDAGRILLDELAKRRLRLGFTGPRRRADGSGFRWVEGPEAALILHRSRPTETQVTLSVRTFRGLADQQLRLVVNGSSLGVADLLPGRNTVSFRSPQEAWHPGRNLVVLQFRRVAPGREGSEPRAAAVDWIELAPLSDRDESATAATEAIRGREEEGMIEDSRLKIEDWRLEIEDSVTR
jgi:hypothetical protein